ncbi:MAG: pyridoxal phosphate-dependent aminotransferase [Thermodesulfobacteriota bacterium]
MKISISERIAGLSESVTLAITAKAKAMKAAGMDVIGFGAGEPDFGTPQNICAAAVRAIGEGFTRYTPVGGIPELKKAVIAKFSLDNALQYTPEEVIVSCGAKHSLYNIFQAILDPGDEVIIPSPYWVSYPAVVSLAGGVPVILGTGTKSGFKMTPQGLRSAITPRTRALIINSPSNPAGTLYTEDELAGIAGAALEHDLLIISDEIYEKISYLGRPAPSIASLSEEVKARTVVVNGVSKAYAMTGWRIGYAAGPVDIIKAMTKLQSQSTSNPTSISQWASVEALTGPQETVDEMVSAFLKRRDAMVTGLNAIPGVRCVEPEGAFYVFADFSGLYGGRAGERIIKSSLEMAAYLLEGVGVALVPGSAFGEDAFLRLSFATSMENITEGIKRIGLAAGDLSA